ncbi:MAG: hypothetical protein BMS9Abin19_0311 [Gammaproteobacteria bacterium]|nr:MAG: hypothetical protein BMS9Abin19_0311 [Gammaproteobacteria bacterium]
MYIRWIETLIIKLFCIFFSSTITAYVFAAEAMSSDTMPSDATVLQNSSCIQCHEKQNNALIRNREKNAHATANPAVNCISCHGQLHKDIAKKARRDETCIDCHGGKKTPVVHSYSSSKHGTLMQLEKNTYDWSQSFELANYRTPGCGYCHMHQNNHNVSTTVRHTLITGLMNNGEVEKVQDKTRAVCQDCHSPRYITRLFENGEAMLEIARKKVREADAIIEQAEEIFSDAELEPARKQRQKMQHHFENVHLGVGHQSPDYQWWHGQPALDGDLLRIKDMIGELHRMKK